MIPAEHPGPGCRWRGELIPDKLAKRELTRAFASIRLLLGLKSICWICEICEIALHQQPSDTTLLGSGWDGSVGGWVGGGGVLRLSRPLVGGGWKR